LLRDRGLATGVGGERTAVATSGLVRPEDRGSGGHLAQDRGSHAIGKRVGRDGRARPVNPAAVRQQVADAIRRDPAASLRTIARLLQVSPETVRSVRSSMAGSAGTARSLPTPKVLEMVYQRELPAPWRRDAALASTDSGEEFVAWFESTLVAGDARDRAGLVPLSRVYEIADEARRRARWWIAMAEALEGRTRRRYSA
jgi:hypothetical protein